MSLNIIPRNRTNQPTYNCVQYYICCDNLSVGKNLIIYTLYGIQCTRVIYGLINEID